MPKYNLGTLTIAGHNTKKLTDALGISEERFEAIVELAREAWNYGDTVSDSIEYIAQRVNGSEAVLTILILGRIWEEKDRARRNES